MPTSHKGIPTKFPTVIIAIPFILVALLSVYFPLGSDALTFTPAATDNLCMLGLPYNIAHANDYRKKKGQTTKGTTTTNAADKTMLSNHIIE